MSNNARLTALEKHAPQPTLIHSILIGGSSISLRNNRDEKVYYIELNDNLRNELDYHRFAKRITLQSYLGDLDIKINTMIWLINYFVSKGYRITRSHNGVGSYEQIQFLRSV
jgi:hypothetical protein